MFWVIAGVGRGRVGTMRLGKCEWGRRKADRASKAENRDAPALLTFGRTQSLVCDDQDPSHTRPLTITRSSIAVIAGLCWRAQAKITLALRPRQWISIAQGKMSSVIILSSPPKTFARSPTPVEFSSPLPSPHTLLTSQGSQQTPKKFKSANVQRDGFGGLSSARGLLGAKIGAENMLIRSPKNMKSGLKNLSPKRFKSSSTGAKVEHLGALGCESENEDPIHDEVAYCGPAASEKVSVPVGSLKRFNSAPCASFSSRVIASNPRNGLNALHSESQTMEMADDPIEVPNPKTGVDVSQDRKGDIPRAREVFSPLNIEMAVSRKTDWTPTKDATNVLEDESPSVKLSRSFSAGLIGSFGYEGDTAVVTPASRHEIDTAPTKRRRIDMVKTNATDIASIMPPPKTAAVKKPKAPPKKALTITGLATSNYSGRDNEEEEPTILERFLSTQARALETGHDDITLEIAKVKAVKKQRASGKAPQKRTLVSPTSAIKALANQDALFGSASQLARDESPSLVRDTLEAIRKSESHNFSSPTRTQNTEPFSVESTTPQATTGISRFTKTRGLWSAAGRDEDNALLHVDTIDIDSFDTPDLRQAFPGKDVLVQPGVSRARETISPEKQSPCLRGGGSLRTNGNIFWDIDEMETPMPPIRATTLPTVQVRALHTTTRAESPRKRALIPPFDNAGPLTKTLKAKRAENAKNRTPKKPAFEGLTTDKLQKQIAAYGFKPMKKREQMIAVLEKCWEQKHAPAGIPPSAAAEPAVEKIDDSRKHGDYLSNVHGLANRPVPKEKKVPKPRKPKEPQEPKEPKARKKREPKAVKEKDPNAPKVVRKRKSKIVLSEDRIVEVDELEAVDGNVLTEAAATALADAAIAKATARSSASTKVKTPIKAKPPTTPPATSSPASATSVPLVKEISTCTVASSPETTIDAQIELAITSYRAPASTNHQKEPTWHEKILMYDPVVLEDLAAWLNTVGLGLIGEDREVSALEVREWCEQRGICCLWRGGWRGNKAVKE